MMESSLFVSKGTSLQDTILVIDDVRHKIVHIGASFIPNRVAEFPEVFQVQFTADDGKKFTLETDRVDFMTGIVVNIDETREQNKEFGQKA